jgi:hypothetical protein
MPASFAEEFAKSALASLPCRVLSEEFEVMRITGWFPVIQMD